LVNACSPVGAVGRKKSLKGLKMKTLKNLFCKHTLAGFVRNIHGDEINHVGGHRSWWKCETCDRMFTKPGFGPNGCRTGKNIPTFTASVLLGLKVGYTETLHTIDQVKEAIKTAVAKVEGYTFSGTLTPTSIYANGSWGVYEEPALIISASIYPRFPMEVEKFKTNFTAFIGHLATDLKQERVAVVFSDESFMLETEHCKEPDLK